MAKITVEYFRELIVKVNNDEIQIAKAVELLNEKASEPEWIPYSEFEHMNAPEFENVVFLFLNGNKKRYNEDWNWDGEPTHYFVLPNKPM